MGLPSSRQLHTKKNTILHILTDRDSEIREEWTKTQEWGWSRPANSHSFRVRLKQLPHPISSFRVRKSEKIAPILTSFIYVIIEQNFEKIAPFLNLTQLPHLRLAGLAAVYSYSLQSFCMLIDAVTQEMLCYKLWDDISHICVPQRRASETDMGQLCQRAEPWFQTPQKQPAVFPPLSCEKLF